MTNEAAIKATYADYRRVKGRKVLQLILEVPLEQAPQVHEAFGEPLPDGSTWVGVARIDPNVTAKPERKGGKLAQRAGILCGEKAFQDFIRDKSGYALPGDDPDANKAARRLRDMCGVASRADLDHDEAAGRKFLDLEASYKAWLVAA